MVVSRKFLMMVVALVVIFWVVRRGGLKVGGDVGLSTNGNGNGNGNG